MKSTKNLLVKFVKENGKKFVSERDGEVSYEHWVDENTAIFYVEGKSLSIYKSAEGLTTPSDEELSDIAGLVFAKSVA